jgi:hypothetical protein
MAAAVPAWHAYICDLISDMYWRVWTRADSKQDGTQDLVAVMAGEVLRAVRLEDAVPHPLYELPDDPAFWYGFMSDYVNTSGNRNAVVRRWVLKGLAW